MAVSKVKKFNVFYDPSLRKQLAAITGAARRNLKGLNAMLQIVHLFNQMCISGLSLGVLSRDRDALPDELTSILDHFFDGHRCQYENDQAIGEAVRVECHLKMTEAHFLIEVLFIKKGKEVLLRRTFEVSFSGIIIRQVSR